MARWRDCEVAVRATVVPRYFWTTASLDVYIGDDRVLQTGGALRKSGNNEEVFHRGDAQHVAAVSWRVPRQVAIDYDLAIDREPVDRGRVVPGNWPLLLIPLASAVGLAFFLGLFVMFPVG